MLACTLAAQLIRGAESKARLPAGIRPSVSKSFVHLISSAFPHTGFGSSRHAPPWVSPQLPGLNRATWHRIPPIPLRRLDDPRLGPFHELPNSACKETPLQHNYPDSGR